MRNSRLMNPLGAIVFAAAFQIASPTYAAQSPAQTPPAPKATSGQPDAAKTTQPTKHAGASDTGFVKQAAEGGMMEVAKGKLAAEKGSHDAVKQFGQKMVDDHTKAGDELKSIASGKSITLPGDTTRAPMQALLAKLEKLEAAAFDRAYVDDQIRDHEKTIALFEREAKTGKDAELKAFAEKTLPALKEHLSMVRDLKTKLAKGGTN
jgi:putative membrane protein